MNIKEIGNQIVCEIQEKQKASTYTVEGSTKASAKPNLSKRATSLKNIRIYSYVFMSEAKCSDQNDSI